MKNLLYFSLVLLVSCSKFVDVVPKGRSIPSTVDQLAQLMNNSDYDAFSNTIVQVSATNVAYMTDDLKYNESGAFLFSALPVADKNKHTWAPYIYTANEDDPDWNKLYKSNNILNYILENIDLVSEGKSYNRADVKGQALFHRAMNYFVLVNQYAKQYDAQTASEDPGVPLVLSSNINVSYPRSTAAEVYALILSDLEEALRLLTSDDATFNHIPGKGAAYALLARVHLFMGNYDEAFSNATQAILLNGTLTDYNTLAENVPGSPIAGLSNYELQFVKNPEVIYYRQSIGYGYGLASDDLLSVFDKNTDLRYKYMFVNLSAFGLTGFIPYNYLTFTGIMSAEVWLTKAEAALRKGNPDIPTSIEALDRVRQNRIKSNDFAPTTATEPDQLLQLILQERRRETRFGILRWYDLKRLNKDSKTAKTLIRTVGGATYTLQPNDPLYVLPIPLNVLQLNALSQNPAPGR